MLETRLGKFIVFSALAIPLIIVCLIIQAVREDTSKILQHADFVSPDKQWTATLETVDNGAGFGQGMVYYEVHLRRPGEKVADHGDQDDSSIFYIEKMDDARTPQLNWSDASHLSIAYDTTTRSKTQPGKHLAKFHNVVIMYQTLPAQP